MKKAIHKLKTRKSPGEDGVSNEMLRQLSRKAEDLLLLLINKSWVTAEIPAAWRKAVIVAIPKKGTALSVPGSYRPISLLSCISKLTERMLQNRLQYWLEERNIINKNQAGFRRGRSTVDQLTRVTQTIFDTFEQRKPGRATLALLDFQKAYDRVWRDGLIAKMGRLQIPPTLQDG